jgi:hypothetical protein
MAKIINVDIVTESISNAWPAYYDALARQLDLCSEGHEWCANCPVVGLCVLIWTEIINSKDGMSAAEFKGYSRRIAGLWELKQP